MKAYLGGYTGVENFIDEMKTNPEKLDELKTILLELEVESEEERHSTILANAFIDNINHFLEEESDETLSQYTIIAHKENIRIKIFFQSHKEEYIEKIETIEHIVESIRFIES
ncbi:hypothetical protein Amet_2247 [Alkaliphilus metalliredigens QYMF]|uniref:Uncharacterized protein n=1 Tax=Alkaliphilus metalliredigens (strain QYMF) TaxID=293826 RepID=A6TQD7_ALKMQ|nr:hypothetical protein [Alkaliphilus metalliredigens]ABR48405.1 hypothetical protein Amet_2247 [Alkaliphilus metalliredigens QYMF]